MDSFLSSKILPFLRVLYSGKDQYIIVEWGAGYAILYSTIIYLIRFNDLQLTTTLLFSLLILPIDLLATFNEKVTAFIFTKRALIATIMTLLSIVSSVILAIKYPSENTSFIIPGQFFLQGLVVGIVIRMLLLALFARMVRGHSIGTQKFLLIVGLTIFVCLFPLGQTHKHFAAFYIAGFGIGFLLHFAVRNKKHSRAQRFRRAQNIFRMTEDPTKNTDLTVRDIEAIRYFANENWKRLKKLLEKYHNQLTTPMVIVKASMLRLQGQYAYAKEIIETELDNPNRNKNLDYCLYLHEALNYGELGRKEKTFEVINKVLDTEPSCLLANITLGLRLAEEIPLIANQNAGTTLLVDPTKPLGHLWKAMKVNESEISQHLLTLVTGAIVPVTWTFLLDAYGYVLLKAGSHRFSKSLFIQCIYEDPNFSSPYLHLGEWYIADKEKAKQADDQVHLEKVHRLAVLCLNIAIQLEDKKDSLISRRAADFLTVLTTRSPRT